MIRPISYTEILAAKELLAEYAAECAAFELGEANPRADLYELLEKSGNFLAFGVHEDSALVGFACVLIYTLPHFDKKIAASESIFVSEVFRNSSAGHQLMDGIEGYARGEGCWAFLYSAPVGSQLDKLLSIRKASRHTSNTYVVKL